MDNFVESFGELQENCVMLTHEGISERCKILIVFLRLHEQKKGYEYLYIFSKPDYYMVDRSFLRIDHSYFGVVAAELIKKAINGKRANAPYRKWEVRDFADELHKIFTDYFIELKKEELK